MLRTWCCAADLGELDRRHRWLKYHLAPNGTQLPTGLPQGLDNWDPLDNCDRRSIDMAK